MSLTETWEPNLTADTNADTKGENVFVILLGLHRNQLETRFCC